MTVQLLATHVRPNHCHSLKCPRWLLIPSMCPLALLTTATCRQQPFMLAASGQACWHSRFLHWLFCPHWARLLWCAQAVEQLCSILKIANNHDNNILNLYKYLINCSRTPLEQTGIGAAVLLLGSWNQQKLYKHIKSVSAVPGLLWSSWKLDPATWKIAEMPAGSSNLKNCRNISKLYKYLISCTGTPVHDLQGTKVAELHRIEPERHSIKFRPINHYSLVGEGWKFQRAQACMSVHWQVQFMANNWRSTEGFGTTQESNQCSETFCYLP